MEIGKKLNYFGKDVEVVEFDKAHVVIRFENGTQICTDRLNFKNTEKSICLNCYCNHNNTDYDGYCCQSCFDGIK